VSVLKISHYKLLRQLGSGGASQVYLAEDTNLHRKVAIKLLHKAYTQDPKQLQRFRQEAEWTSMLSHPNLLTIFEIGESDGTHFIVSEYVEGETLRKRLGRGKLPTREALDIALSVGAALRVAHEAWVVHRDIKPENIMLHTNGFVKVLDFGVAKLTEPSGQNKAITLPRMVVGTLQYLAPEQIRADAVDPRTDLWSLGVVMYEMLAGVAPFASHSIVELFEGITRRDPAPLRTLVPEVPVELEKVVHKLLSKEAEERYQTTVELLRDLEEVREELVFRERSRRRNEPGN
jgi:eukaryotic-like serine/threonine-protein kinase